MSEEKNDTGFSNLTTKRKKKSYIKSERIVGGITKQQLMTVEVLSVEIVGMFFVVQANVMIFSILDKLMVVVNGRVTSKMFV